MPIFQAGPGQAPNWCELEGFEFVSLKPGESRAFRKATPKEELIVCRGSLVLRFGEMEVTLMEGSKFDFNGLGAVEYTLLPYWQAPLVCRLQGRWSAITSSGVFTAQTATPPTHDTAYAYQKTTGFDNHYHCARSGSKARLKAGNAPATSGNPSMVRRCRAGSGGEQEQDGMVEGGSKEFIRINRFARFTRFRRFTRILNEISCKKLPRSSPMSTPLRFIQVGTGGWGGYWVNNVMPRLIDEQKSVVDSMGA